MIHDVGNIWVVYYQRYHERTHFALIHADGQALSASLADQVRTSAREVRLALDSLSYLAPPRDGPSDRAVDEARRAYFRYLETACGYIQLDGMPADEQVVCKKLWADVEAILEKVERQK